MDTDVYLILNVGFTLLLIALSGYWQLIPKRQSWSRSIMKTAAVAASAGSAGFIWSLAATLTHDETVLTAAGVVTLAVLTPLAAAPTMVIAQGELFTFYQPLESAEQDPRDNLRASADKLLSSTRSERDDCASRLSSR